ncbi:MAG: N-(5'-phosphoribosyl)anthranilate isomerase [Alphaproteobacteria bacterium MarineAlpha2_Bin1]|nr:MAG: N-(5'-phosphoribosyl)anthranilate isomerase [Alphaproteobacteria bacterium MarineAlpha2_Bin1]|tara:strand:+ start:404 stop:1054 length:651 start_codon:yes stop_codon:yes gene_type:complete
MHKKIKICGLTKKREFDLAVSLSIDFVGIVFHKPSIRYIKPVKIRKIINEFHNELKFIAVVVDPSDADLENIINNIPLFGIQLHGNETLERVRQVKKKTNLSIIKAIPIDNTRDILLAKEYEDAADMLLFDSKPGINSKSPGGNAKTFDWNLLIGQYWEKPWFLSGGLDINNINNALSITKAEYCDVSSGVEVLKGKKDLQLMKTFTEKVREFKNG